MNIKTLFEKSHVGDMIDAYGWVRTTRTSGSTLGFCNINDGSNVSGLQIIISSEHFSEDKIEDFFKSVKIGCFLNCSGKLVESPAKGQKYEMMLEKYEIKGHVEEDYPLCKSKMNLDTLRNHIHLRNRTNTFGSVMRIRSSLMKIMHDFYHEKGFLHLDPNIITTNECEGGAGVFQVTENDLTELDKLPRKQNHPLGMNGQEVADKIGDAFEMLGTNIKNSAEKIKQNDNAPVEEKFGHLVDCAANIFDGVTSKVNNHVNEMNKYDWSKDHFNCPTYLTVSSQLQLESLACSLGNVYTTNKSFRSEHSSTSKHVSEFTHLEIEMVNNNLDDLMDIGEEMIKYAIHEIMHRNMEDLENLNKFVSKGIVDQLCLIANNKFERIKYEDIIDEINYDIVNENVKLEKINSGDDLSSLHENYITKKYATPVFVTHWPISIKSFYMKQCDNGLCECFDLLMPFGIGELIGASQREDDYGKLMNMMKVKNVDEKGMEFYTDLRKYGSCPHGGFGLGFDRLLMLVTGIQNIKDVIPFPVFYKSCKY